MAGVFFVTRLKDHAAFEVVEECKIPQNRNIRADQFIRLTSVKAQADYPDLLRLIVAWDAENQREIVLLTIAHVKVPACKYRLREVRTCTQVCDQARDGFRNRIGIDLTLRERWSVSAF